ncbi:hypothetical protein [Candidatus Mycoplasma pogonae]
MYVRLNQYSMVMMLAILPFLMLFVQPQLRSMDQNLRVYSGAVYAFKAKRWLNLISVFLATLITGIMALYFFFQIANAGFAFAQKILGTIQKLEELDWKNLFELKNPISKETGEPISNEEFLEILRQQLAGLDAIQLQQFFKEFFTDKFIYEVLTALMQKDLLATLIPKGTDFKAIPAEILNIFLATLPILIFWLIAAATTLIAILITLIVLILIIFTASGLLMRSICIRDNKYTIAKFFFPQLAYAHIHAQKSFFQKSTKDEHKPASIQQIF